MRLDNRYMGVYSTSLSAFERLKFATIENRKHHKCAKLGK